MTPQIKPKYSILALNHEHAGQTFVLDRKRSTLGNKPGAHVKINAATENLIIENGQTLKDQYRQTPLTLGSVIHVPLDSKEYAKFIIVPHQLQLHAQHPTLLAISGEHEGKSFTLDRDVSTIGTKPGAHIKLQSGPAVQKQIIRQSDGFYLKTKDEEQKITRPMQIEVGESKYWFLPSLNQLKKRKTPPALPPSTASDPQRGYIDATDSFLEKRANVQDYTLPTSKATSAITKECMVGYSREPVYKKLKFKKDEKQIWTKIGVSFLDDLFKHMAQNKVPRATAEKIINDAIERNLTAQSAVQFVTNNNQHIKLPGIAEWDLNRPLVTNPTRPEVFYDEQTQYLTTKPYSLQEVDQEPNSPLSKKVYVPKFGVIFPLSDLNSLELNGEADEFDREIKGAVALHSIAQLALVGKRTPNQKQKIKQILLKRYDEHLNAISPTKPIQTKRKKFLGIF